MSKPFHVDYCRTVSQLRSADWRRRQSIAAWRVTSINSKMKIRTLKKGYTTSFDLLNYLIDKWNNDHVISEDGRELKFAAQVWVGLALTSSLPVSNDELAISPLIGLNRLRHIRPSSPSQFEYCISKRNRLSAIEPESALRRFRTSS